MPTPVSLATLMLRVRRRSNLEGHEEFIGDAELTDEINNSISEWWDLVTLTTFQGQYARSPWPIVTVANQQVYPLAPNHGKIISVDLVVSGMAPVPVKAYQEEQRGMFTLFPLVGWSPGIRRIWYQQQGNAISFLPIPSGGYLVQVNYVPTAPVLATPYGVLNSINGWEEWIVIDAAIKCLIKCGNASLATSLQGRLEAQADRIRHAAAEADLNQSEGVHETEAYGEWDYGLF